MKKLSATQWIGIALIVSAIIEWAPLPFLGQLRNIATLVILCLGIYFILK